MLGVDVQRLQHDADLLERFQQAAAVEDGDVGGRQERGGARSPGAGQQDERARLGQSEVRAGDTDLCAGRVVTFSEV